MAVTVAVLFVNIVIKTTECLDCNNSDICMLLCYRLSVPYPKCLGPEVSCISDFFCFFLDFGVLAHYNETAGGWEPDRNAKAAYVSRIACGSTGFV
jgi:hypothetical protein